MVIDKPLAGQFIIMRSVEETDAEFILKLRLDEDASQFISKTENSLENQIVWIRQQRKRDNDYYFMFTNKENRKLGVISIYNVKIGTAESGRFVSFGDSIHNMEAILLLHDFAYYTLGVNLIHFSVYKINTMVINMWKKLGCQIVCEKKVNDIDSYYFEIPLEIYERIFKPRVQETLSKVRIRLHNSRNE